jgi:hypothetical protein
MSAISNLFLPGSYLFFFLVEVMLLQGRDHCDLSGLAFFFVLWSRLRNQTLGEFIFCFLFYCYNKIGDKKQVEIVLPHGKTFQ